MDTNDNFENNLNKELQELLKGFQCLTCRHLNFYDWYICAARDFSNGFIPEEPVEDCDCYSYQDNSCFWR